jgi:hypothetical protein
MELTPEEQEQFFLRNHFDINSIYSIVRSLTINTSWFKGDGENETLLVSRPTIILAVGNAK